MMGSAYLVACNYMLKHSMYCFVDYFVANKLSFSLQRLAFLSCFITRDWSRQFVQFRPHFDAYRPIVPELL